MSGFRLDVDSPYPKPDKEHLQSKPEPMPYPNNQIRFGHYGHYVESMIRKCAAMEEGEGKIMIASFGTFSTGINVKNIHTIYLTESFKSEVIIRQSIGRGLRKHESKSMLNIVDFVDDMRYTGDGRLYKNYLYRHGEARREIYTEQKFPYTIKNVKF
jgi:hypothetical protein